jgi:hypothetical protein
MRNPVSPHDRARGTSALLEQVSVGLNRKDFQGFVNERV